MIMTKNKKIKAAIVTGASGGIGRSITTALCLKGFHVVANYNSSEIAVQTNCKHLKRFGLTAYPFKADISNQSEVAEMIKYTLQKFGRIDVLVNNAGIAQSSVFQDISEEDWDYMINVNLKGTFLCSQAVVPAMIKAHQGRIINISSIWGMVGASCEVHYSAAKAGVIGFTKALAKELAPSGIQVNCVAPGIIKTAMLDDFTERDLKAMEEEIPAMRIGTPADVARFVAFLATDAGTYLTGQIISPNGGLIV